MAKKNEAIQSAENGAVAAPSPQQTKLQTLLRELFQLDQPDLDFGLYRIMHAKAREIEQFLNDDLLKIIGDAFAGNQAEKIAQAKADYERKRQLVLDDGGNPDASRQVQQALAEYQDAQESQGEDAELYDHLYRFFERYYDGGDFLSRRYYARATSEKAEPYAVPYDGSEVYLHWANKDQYYIKTAENFRQFSMDMAQAKRGEAQLFEQTGALKLHFTLADAEEGAHNNVKAAGERYFIVDAAQPLEWSNGELTVRFHYCADPEKTGQAGKWRETRNARNETAILNALQVQAQSGDEHAHRASQYAAALATEIPKGRDGRQTLLGKYLNQYTAKNSMDYFIHKNLGGFLKRELDFYIKNELFRLDDLGTPEAPNPQQYDRLLKKALTLRGVAHKLIEFLAQTEEFQKKLWLKKKFVVDTQWLVTLDKAPASLYPQIKANVAQWAEWVKLGFVNEDADRDALLNSESKLVLDTQYFDADFTAQLLAHISQTSGNLDEATDGVLVHSENFQALNLMQARYLEQVKHIYIDPPYNKGYDGFIYKDSYQHSAWLCMMADRISFKDSFLSDSGVFSVSIDDDEDAELVNLLDSTFGRNNLIGHLIWDRNHSAQAGLFKIYHEYICNYAKSKSNVSAFLSGEGVIEAGAMKKPSKRHKLQDFTFPAGTKIESPDGSEFKGRWGRAEFVELISGDMTVKGGKLESPVILRAAWTQFGQMTKYFKGETVVDTKGQKIIEFFFTATGKLKYRKERGLKIPSSVLKFGTASQSTNVLSDILGFAIDQTPKPVELNKFFIEYYCRDDDSILDYFAGSGTTGHAVINLNREDDGNRKYILVEMGDYFDTVLKPRIAKVIYSADWKDGKPAPSPQPSPAGEGVIMVAYPNW